MAVHHLIPPVTVRVFRVAFRPDLDAGPQDDIPFGLIGDLRMAPRYAVGLIARNSATPAESARVGRLAKRLVKNPFRTLKALHADIWGHEDNRTAAFDAAVRHSHSSLMFLPIFDGLIAVDTEGLDFGGDIDGIRGWCKDVLRSELRSALGAWKSDQTVLPIDGTEDLEEAA